MPHPAIPGLPAGWTILEFHRSTDHPRDAVVLCERTEHLPEEMNYVTWSANMIEGGCYCGNYWSTYDKARSDFAVRKANLR